MKNLTRGSRARNLNFERTVTVTVPLVPPFILSLSHFRTKTLFQTLSPLSSLSVPIFTIEFGAIAV